MIIKGGTGRYFPSEVSTVKPHWQPAFSAVPGRHIWCHSGLCACLLMNDTQDSVQGRLTLHYLAVRSQHEHRGSLLKLLLLQSSVVSYSRL